MYRLHQDSFNVFSPHMQDLSFSKPKITAAYWIPNPARDTQYQDESIITLSEKIVNRVVPLNVHLLYPIPEKVCLEF